MKFAELFRYLNFDSLPHPQIPPAARATALSLLGASAVLAAPPSHAAVSCRAAQAALRPVAVCEEIADPRTDPNAASRVQAAQAEVFQVGDDGSALCLSGKYSWKQGKVRTAVSFERMPVAATRRPAGGRLSRQSRVSSSRGLSYDPERKVLKIVAHHYGPEGPMTVAFRMRCRGAAENFSRAGGAKGTGHRAREGAMAGI